MTQLTQSLLVASALTIQAIVAIAAIAAIVQRSKRRRTDSNDLTVRLRTSTRPTNAAKAKAPRDPCPDAAPTTSNMRIAATNGR
jgi:hypothetical protein